MEDVCTVVKQNLTPIGMPRQSNYLTTIRAIRKSFPSFNQSKNDSHASYNTAMSTACIGAMQKLNAIQTDITTCNVTDFPFPSELTKIRHEGCQLYQYCSGQQSKGINAWRKDMRDIRARAVGALPRAEVIPQTPKERLQTHLQPAYSSDLLRPTWFCGEK